MNYEPPDKPLIPTMEHQEPFSVVWECWQMHVTPELQKPRQEDHEFKASLACIVSYCIRAHTNSFVPC